MSRFLRTRRFRLVAAGLIGAVALYGLTGSLILPPLLKSVAESYASEQLGRRLTLEELTFNPFLLRAEVRGLNFRESDGSPILAFKSLVADFEWGSLVRRAWVFSGIRLDAPRLNVTIDSRGRLNLARLAHDLHWGEDGSAPPPLLFRNVTVGAGTVDLADLQGKPARLQVQSVDIRLRELAMLPDRLGAYSVAAKTEAGETLSWKGSLGLQPIVSEGTLSFGHVRVATLWSFFRDGLNLAQPAGVLSAEARYRFAYRSGKADFGLRGLHLALSGLTLGLPGQAEPLLRLKTARLREGSFDLVRRRLDIGRLSFSGGRLKAERGPDGSLDWSGLLALAPRDGKTAAGSRPSRQAPEWHIGAQAVEFDGWGVEYRDVGRALTASLENLRAGFSASAKLGGGESQYAVGGLEGAWGPWIVEARGQSLLRGEEAAFGGGRLEFPQRRIALESLRLRGGEALLSADAQGRWNWLALAGAGGPQKAPAPKSDAPSWAVEAGAVELAGFRGRWVDRRLSNAPLLAVFGLNFTAQGLSTVPGKPAAFHLRAEAEAGGRLVARGKADPWKRRAEAQVGLERFSLLPLQPYLARYTKLSIASGTVSLRGRLEYGAGKGGPAWAYDGGARVEVLSLLESANREPLLGWDGLDAPVLRLSLNPDRLEVDEIRLEKPFGKLVIFADGGTNLKRVWVPGAAQNRDAEKPSAAATENSGVESFAFKLGRLWVNGGVLEFADLSLRPQFKSRIHGLGGVVVGLGTAAGPGAQGKLEGQVDEYGFARIEGGISVRRPKDHADLAMTFRNLELTHLSPYSGKFLGYGVTSGKLSLELRYQIEQGRLVGDNRIILDQLTLGERVESPGALQLPLELAVALLKDADGRIDIGLPVRGDLNHPEFSYGHLIGRALGNFLTQIVTAPFRALGRLFGSGGEGLESVDFEAGSGALLPPEREKLKKIAEALRQRPSLQLLVQGRYDAAADGEELKSRQLLREVTRRMGRQTMAGEEPEPLDFGNARTQRILDLLFVEAASDRQLESFRKELEQRYGRPVTPVNPLLGAMGQASPDVEYYKALFDRLAESARLPEKELTDLAEGRAAAIAEELERASGIGAGRIERQAPTANGARDGRVPVPLALRPLKTPPQ